MQSTEGGVKRAREFLISSIPLTQFSSFSDLNYADFLNGQAEALALKLPRPEDGRPNWGAARKAINIFMRLCAMNKDLHQGFNLVSIEPYLEVPLDSHVVKKIDREIGSAYAKNFRIKNLTSQLSSEIQSAATKIAMDKGLHRYELDVLYWNSASLI